MKMKKTLLLCLAVALLVSVTGCSSARKDDMPNSKDRLVQNGETVNAIQSSQSKEYYEAIAFGGPSAEAASMAAKKQTSFEAAKISAMNDIAGYLYGVKLESGMTVKDATLKDSNISAEVSTFIRGAEVIKREWDDEGGCSVTMRINLKEFKEKLKQLGIK